MYLNILVTPTAHSTKPMPVDSLDGCRDGSVSLSPRQDVQPSDRWPRTATVSQTRHGRPFGTVDEPVRIWAGVSSSSVRDRKSYLVVACLPEPLPCSLVTPQAAQPAASFFDTGGALQGQNPLHDSGDCGLGDSADMAVIEAILAGRTITRRKGSIRLRFRDRFGRLDRVRELFRLGPTSVGPVSAPNPVKP